ncbi:hypothetical protein [Mycolicibacterium peregrinum]|uniref:hypothetical protein n=1 Tax=Mycolicibacterium peregrinum TaxID=43304 RepID=UPI0013F4EF23|nr:hypothetical protein [Mycolicibacterium peregrinum]
MGKLLGSTEPEPPATGPDEVVGDDDPEPDEPLEEESLDDEPSESSLAVVEGAAELVDSLAAVSDLLSSDPKLTLPPPTRNTAPAPMIATTATAPAMRPQGFFLPGGVPGPAG